MVTPARQSKAAADMMNTRFANMAAKAERELCLDRRLDIGHKLCWLRRYEIARQTLDRDSSDPVCRRFRGWAGGKQRCRTIAFVPKHPANNGSSSRCKWSTPA